MNNSGKISTHTGRNVTVTRENHNGIKTSLKRFLIIEIEYFSVKAGSQNQLSLTLNKSDTFVQMALKRGSFSALERLWKECVDYYAE